MPRSACFLGSSLPLDFLSLVHTVAWLHHKRAFVPREVRATPGFGMCTDLYDFVDSERGVLRRATGRHPLFWDLWRDCLGLRCFEPRDKIFGMIGLMHSSKAGHPYLKPDYQKPVQDTLRDATRFALAESAMGLTHLLGSIESRALNDPYTRDCPSWVPPWHIEDPYQVSALGVSFASSVRMGGRIKTIHTPEVLLEPNLLELTGFGVDTISGHVGSAFAPHEDGLMYLERLCTWWQESLKVFGTPNDKEATASVLMGSRNFTGSECTRRDLLEMDDLHHILLDLNRFPLEPSRTSDARATSFDPGARRFPGSQGQALVYHGDRFVRLTA